MGKSKKTKKNKTSKKITKKLIITMGIVLMLVIGAYLCYINIGANPANTLEQYVAKINEEKYEEMYEMLDDKSKNKISKDDFIKRNKNIYQGIDMSNMQIDIKQIQTMPNGSKRLVYQTKMNAGGGEVSFENNVVLSKGHDQKYKIDWSSNLIFPELNDTDKVKITTEEATRGEITARNGEKLACNGKASSIGIVKGKLGENKDTNIEKMAKLLNISEDSIKSKIGAGWVKEDSFVPIKTISMEETELKEKLLQIPGVKITSVDTRTYPLGQITAHLTGYVQNITKEELEQNSGYRSSSVIGKAGLEKQYESRLKGKDGVEIYIVDEKGNRKSTIIKQEKQDGDNIKLTINYNIQYNLYNQLKNDKGLFVVMNPDNGEILALVSTPSYDVNKMVLGISNDEWQALSNDNATPMLPRYLQSYCPGSTFKPITGAIGLSTNSLSKDETFTYNGLSWKKDESWGNYNITTLTAYKGVKNLENALIHSDNIYFAQATLKIGKDNFINGLKKLKFNEKIDWDFNTAKSQYSNSDTIKTETGLADSGYGQGQVLVNPIHMASIYSAFLNDGNMLKPHIEYKQDSQKQYLVESAFTPEAAEEIKRDLIQIVENPEGTAKDMKINGLTIGGKTGTAELKSSKEEKANTIGWFDCFVKDNNSTYLIIGMVEEANNNGGSHYVIPMIRNMFVK